MPSFISKGRTGCAEVVRKADRWQGMYALQRGPSKIVANTRRGDWNLLIYGVICVQSQKWLCEPKLRFFSSLKILTIFLFQALLVRLRSPKIREINQKDSILEPQWGMSVFRLHSFVVDGFQVLIYHTVFRDAHLPGFLARTCANVSPCASVNSTFKGIVMYVQGDCDFITVIDIQLSCLSVGHRSVINVTVLFGI